MPAGSYELEPGIGLALSGGGFRATLFHCGALWRLNELGYLPKLSRISSVSGGSITNGYLALQWTHLQFLEQVAINFRPLIVEPLRVFCGKTIDWPSGIMGILNPWSSVSEEVEKTYRKSLFGDATLQDIPDTPRFIFNATNLATGVSFRFSKPYAADYKIGMIEQPSFRLSQAVTASSAFPPFLSPYALKTDPSSYKKVEGATLYDDLDYRKALKLTDGGAYDNLGLETVWDRFDTVLVSDAGAPFGSEEDVAKDWLRQAYRVLNITVNQARALRKRQLVEEFRRNWKKGTYWGIATNVADYGLADALPVSSQVIQELASLRTRLNGFSESEQCRLINWGYAVCDAAMRRHVISGHVPVPKWPYPASPLG